MPTRIVREGINSSPRINALSRGAELLYRRLMSVVDDYGRYYGATHTVIGGCWPTNPSAATASEVEAWLSECAAGEKPLLTMYEVNGCKYLQLNDFGQRTRSKSKFPEPLSATCGRMPADCGQLTDKCPQVADNPPQIARTSRSRYSETETKSESVFGDGARGALVVARQDEPWERYISIFLVGGKLLNERDTEKALRIWLSLGWEEKLQAIRSIEEIVQQRDATFVPLPANHLTDKPWTRRGPGRMIPEPRKRSAAEIGQEQAAAAFIAEMEGNQE